MAPNRVNSAHSGTTRRTSPILSRNQRPDPIAPLTLDGLPRALTGLDIIGHARFALSPAVPGWPSILPERRVRAQRIARLAVVGGGGAGLADRAVERRTLLQWWP